MGIVLWLMFSGAGSGLPYWFALFITAELLMGFPVTSYIIGNYGTVAAGAVNDSANSFNGTTPLSAVVSDIFDGVISVTRILLHLALFIWDTIRSSFASSCQWHISETVAGSNGALIMVVSILLCLVVDWLLRTTQAPPRPASAVLPNNERGKQSVRRQRQRRWRATRASSSNWLW